MSVESFDWIEGDDWLIDELRPKGDVQAVVDVAKQLESRGLRENAASAWDRAFGLSPSDSTIRSRRQRLLDELAVEVRGFQFRYIPAGSFLMGSDVGEVDEGPVHPVTLKAYWLSEAPITWPEYCDIMEWDAPPIGRPRDGDGFSLLVASKLRRRYCLEENVTIGDWYAGLEEDLLVENLGLRADDGRRPANYNTKPMTGIHWEFAEQFCQHLCDPDWLYHLPSEEEWEKGARGGLIGERHAWGSEAPNENNCDFGRFRSFSIQSSRKFPPNDYGLYAVNGGLWEWTSDFYDALAYRAKLGLAPAAEFPDSEDSPSKAERVLRGGSWADCAAVQTVSFRTSNPSHRSNPNFGFRVARSRFPE